MTLFKSHLLVSVWVSFLSKGTKPDPIVQMKESSCHFLLLDLNGLLSVPRLLCSVLFARESNGETCLLFFTDV